MVALDARQRRHQLLVAYHETDAPAGHIVAFAHGEKFHRHVARARHLHDRRRLPAIESDVGVGQVVHHQNIMLARQRHHPLEELQFHALRGGVRREAEYHHLRLGIALAHGALELLEKIDARCHAHRADIRAGNHRAPDMDRVAGIGHQHGIAGIERGQHQVRQALLGADGDDGFRIRIELDGVAGLVPLGDRPAQARDALGSRVAMGVGPAHGIDQFIDDVRRRGAIRIAHRHVDNVFATAARRQLELGGDIEHIGRQAIDARKFARSLGVSHGSLT